MGRKKQKALAEVILGETHIEKLQCPQIHGTKTAQGDPGVAVPTGSKSKNHDWHSKDSVTAVDLYKVLYVQEMPHKWTHHCVLGVQAEGRQPETSEECQKYLLSATGPLWEDKESTQLSTYQHFQGHSRRERKHCLNLYRM